MKIFLSHSSRNKPLIREVRRYLPEHLNTWIDEKQLLVGDNINNSLKNTIETDSDFVVLFVDAYSISSPWVKKELAWALDHENEIGRVFVLPIVLEEEAWKSLNAEQFKERKYLTCLDYDESSVQALANQLIAELFSWLSRDLENQRKPPIQEDVALRMLDDADKFVANVASEIRSIVFPYRRHNPLSIDELFTKLNDQTVIGALTEIQFNQLLVRMYQQGFLLGLVYTGQTVFLNEEHYSWKKDLNISSKKRIAIKALTFIRSGQLIALDAGSTTLELAKHLSQGLKMRVWDDLRLVTNSVSAANRLLLTLAEMGADEANSVLRVYFAGGRIRPNTLASVDLKNNNGFSDIIKTLGGADVCFVGTNGISVERGFTTHANSETQTKSSILELSDKRFILSDSSKFGIEEEVTFASFEDEITIITDSESNGSSIRRVEEYLRGTPSIVVHS